VEYHLPDDPISLNPDSLNGQKKSELFINLQEDAYKLWQTAFSEKENTMYNTKNYLALPGQENSFKVSYPVTTTSRGGFGLSEKVPAHDLFYIL